MNIDPVLALFTRISNSAIANHLTKYFKPKFAQEIRAALRRRGGDKIQLKRELQRARGCLGARLSLRRFGKLSMWFINICSLFAHPRNVTAHLFP